jgi:ribosome-binding protein aMBF1 (putative translation factor)
MNWTHVIWDDLPGGNVEHVEEHDLTTDDVDFVLENYDSKLFSRGSGRPCVFGYIPDGRYITVIYEEENDMVIPVTAYEVSEP